MLVPVAWLLQDPKFQPDCLLPVGWRPPACTNEGCLPPAEPNPHMHDGCDCAKAAELAVSQKTRPSGTCWGNSRSSVETVLVLRKTALVAPAWG